MVFVHCYHSTLFIRMGSPGKSLCSVIDGTPYMICAFVYINRDVSLESFVEDIKTFPISKTIYCAVV
jgi:hypothetical protein